MRRAVIFATLALLLLAVAGVTVAQEEGAFDADAPTGSTGETTVQEGTSTASEATEPGLTVPEATSPGTTTLEGTVPTGESPGAGEGPSVEDEGRDEPSTKPGKPARRQNDDGGAVPQPVEADEGQGTENGAGRPEGKGRPEGTGKGGNGRGGSAGESREAEGGGGGQGKVTVCHKGKKTLSVGAPAQDAHLRHGDTPGDCA